jgi:tetratricopeptide (TPR) repeat protein
MVPRRRTLALFAVALVLRLVYVAEIRSLPWFDVPIVDGANYLRLARVIAGGSLLGGPGAFWQPPLYPYFLAALLRLFGEHLACVYVVQAVLGACSCVLVHAVGLRIFGPRAAMAAGLVMAFYAPLIHFDAQPLIPVLHIVLALSGLALLLRAAGVGGAVPPVGRANAAAWGPFSLAGLMWGLSAIATPNILLVVPGALVWIWRRTGAAGGGRSRARAAGVLAFLAGVALPVGIVAARNLLVAGEPVLISSNGGINFYIGNNADYARAVRLRPGGEFQRLAQEPENAGVVGAAAQSRWFTARALEFLTHYPASAARLYMRKALDLAAGREIPRNDDMYDYRRSSRLLSALLWRRVLAFPFGVIAPLALAGLVASVLGRGAPAGPKTGAPAEGGADDERAGRSLLLIYGGAYAVSVLLFFPTDRYRLPIVPVLALLAGRLLAALRDALRRKTVLAALVAGGVLFNLDAPTPGESWPEEEALNRAYALRVKGRREEARREYQRAIELNPGRIDPYNSLAVMAAEEGNWEEAVWRYRELLAVAPDFVEVRCSLAQALTALGRKEEARHEWETAVYLVPAAGKALADLALSHLEDGQAEPALEYGRRAVQARPDLPETHFALGMSARALRQRDEALRELAEAVRLFPAGSPGHRRAAEVLDRMRRRDREQGAPESAPPPRDGIVPRH